MVGKSEIDEAIETAAAEVEGKAEAELEIEEADVETEVESKAEGELDAVLEREVCKVPIIYCEPLASKQR